MQRIQCDIWKDTHTSRSKLQVELVDEDQQQQQHRHSPRTITMTTHKDDVLIMFVVVVVAVREKRVKHYEQLRLTCSKQLMLVDDNGRVLSRALLTCSLL